ncbi:hypothetical protein CEXT_155081 [Caerostris extrusa]|uniref:Uncharacterized protein n=1 Tax=Caerostris extrusa TaxID=172846 RepID=A0AAV4MGF7_CAEEX|nr:hypothetical protein CEXT_155081 [Caerostris extrusa]
MAAQVEHWDHRSKAIPIRHAVTLNCIRDIFFYLSMWEWGLLIFVDGCLQLLLDNLEGTHKFESAEERLANLFLGI